MRAYCNTISRAPSHFCPYLLKVTVDIASDRAAATAASTHRSGSLGRADRNRRSGSAVQATEQLSLRRL